MYLRYDGALGRIRETYFKKIVRRLAPDSARILDYGCGPGDFILAARSMGLTAAGIDSAPRSVELAAARGLSVMRGTASDLLGRPERYSAIVAQSVLEHVSDGVALVTDLRELLVPGGVLVLSAPTPGPYFWNDPTHVRPYTPASFATLADITGMRCEYLSYVFAFLLGLEVRSPLLFVGLNLIPASIGSNLVAFLRKR